MGGLRSYAMQIGVPSESNEKRITSPGSFERCRMRPLLTSTTCTCASGWISSPPRSAMKPIDLPPGWGRTWYADHGPLVSRRERPPRVTTWTWRRWSSRPSPSIRQSTWRRTRTVAVSSPLRSPCRSYDSSSVATTASERPSGIHSASVTPRLKAVSGLGSPPSSGSTSSCDTPAFSRSERNASERPSGEKRGAVSLQAPCVSRRGRPLPNGTIHRLERSLPPTTVRSL